MSIPFAVVGAVVAALVETSVVPGLTGAWKPDLLFVLTIVATIMLGVEDGLTWAFLGGLMIDFLQPLRQLGSTSLALLLVAGIAALAARVAPQRRVLTAVAAVFALSWVYQVAMIVILAATSGTPARAGPLDLASHAIADLILAIPVAIAARILWLRFGAHERMEF